MFRIARRQFCRGLRILNQSLDSKLNAGGPTLGQGSEYEVGVDDLSEFSPKVAERGIVDFVGGAVPAVEVRPCKGGRRVA